VRERILHGALAILGETGIQELSQVQVARRAHIRQSHLTYYFPRRHDLLEAVATRFIDGVSRDLERLSQAAGPGDPGALLLTLARAIAEPAHMRMLTGLIIEADGDPALRDTLVRETHRLEQTLATLLGGANAPERARRVLATLWGLGLYDFLVREPATPGLPPSFLIGLAAVVPAP
jgi:AcrR family transcriptional regulator